MNKNSENKNWRDVTPEGFETLLEGLKPNQVTIVDSYDYRFEDLLEHLEMSGAGACKTMRAENAGQILHYTLHFQSLEHTEWEVTTSSTQARSARTS